MVDEKNNHVYYILFENYTHGLLLRDILRSEGISSQIAPTPRSIQGQLTCGMSLMLTEDMLEPAKRLIEKKQAEYYDIVEMSNPIQPSRNKFC